ncbi:putative tricarboxylic transport membrane protein [Kineococcus radiotolerans]|uniref:Integral membrane protein n=2 Tax=Kineococcus radiotolerans TaxID=131568 RepID=A6W419_KINRD|nr:tripartite tricarboxylate transporter TctB family protein [Kineococcus radiotolerans]ABS01558.1 integral membrane protein [Kineococcus radiotolerans SRS30216 = ATCC BAA-149]MBB2901315.1 putative tricarboxylic transport membrane protein [Kineococcus radiotolerans]
MTARETGGTPTVATTPATTTRDGGPSRRRWPELLLPLGITGLGVFTLADATTIAVTGAQNTVGPRAFPFAVGALLVAAGVAVVVAVLTGHRGEVEDSEDVDATAGTDWVTVAKLTGSFAALVVLVEPLGWPIAATLLFGGTAWSLGARPVWRPLLVGALIAVGTHVLFTQVLGLFLPAGPLGGVIGFG